MSDDNPTKRRRRVAHVVAGTPPATVRTLQEWDAWRAREDQRMVDEAAEQVGAQVERDLGAVEH